VEVLFRGVEIQIEASRSPCQAMDFRAVGPGLQAPAKMLASGCGSAFVQTVDRGMPLGPGIPEEDRTGTDEDDESE